jgi:FkbM family methyltransferase
MRTLGYHIIHWIQLIRFFRIKDATRIMWKLIMSSSNKMIEVATSSFHHGIRIRKGTSDVPIFHQVFCDLQYDLTWYIKYHPKLIIDAGANVGYGTLYFHHLYPQAQIWSIEPESRNFAQLSWHVRNYSNIHPVQAGVWYQDAPLKIKNLQDEEASFEVEVTTEDKADFHGITIPTILKNSGLEEIDILKMDIEGAEYFLLQHQPEEWLNKTKCLIIELHDHLHPGTSQRFFEVMSKYKWMTIVKGENIVCFKPEIL